MKNSYLLILLLSFALIFSPLKALAVPKCSCGEDRILKLQEPKIIGADVREVQKQLKILGYYNQVITGIYDENTCKSVKKFQVAENITSDGIFGKETLMKLSSIYEKSVSIIPSKKPDGEISIIIDTLERKLTVLSDGKPFKSFPVAVGTFDTPTPIGLFKITQKSSWGEGFGSRWMRLSVPWGTYGIHGTNKPWSIGGFESHGCIRMHNQHVIQLYDWVNVGTKVFIVGGIDGPFTFGLRTLVQGSKGSDVMEVQKRLSNHGYYSGNFDGIFGWETYEAVKAFQKANGLKITGQVDSNTYKALGIMLFE